MILRGFSDELLKLAEDKSPSIGKGLAAGGALGGLGGVAALAADPTTKSIVALRTHSHDIGKILPFLKKMNPRLAEAAEELVSSPSVRHSHLAVPAVVGAVAAGGVQALRKFHHKKTAGSIKDWVNTPSGAMFAAHLPLGGAALGATRAPEGHRLRGALRGTAGEAVGNAAGAGAGLLAAKVLEHTLLKGKHTPWLEPAAIAGGGLIAGPALMHALTKARGR